jgi:hypothetical protein
MMRTPDGHGRVELTRFHTPLAVRAESENAPANALGIGRIMFTVEGIDDVVARLRSHGAELLGEIAQYEDKYRLCFMRGPKGIIIGLPAVRPGWCTVPGSAERAARCSSSVTRSHAEHRSTGSRFQRVADRSP